MSSPKTNSRRKPQVSKVEDSLGRIQPQELEFEKSVLGALLLEKDAYSLISDILTPESFYDPRNQKVYSAISKLHVAQHPVDILTVVEQLRTDGTFDEVGGVAYLSSLTQNIEYHARVIAQKSTARELISYSANVQDKAFDPTQDIDELMQEAEGSLFKLSQKKLKKDYQQIDSVITEAYEMLHKAAERTDGMSGIASGFHALDRMTSGWQNSDLVILAARPAMGKTAFALSMAKNIAVDQNIPVALFSLEMSNVQLINRVIVNTCEIKGEKIKSGQLEAYEWAQLDNKIKDLIGKPMYVDDTPSLSVFELRTKARRLVKEHGVKLIMIDYLQLMNASGMSFGSRQEEVSTISRSLKGLAKELNIPILALSQLNRGVENRPGGENTLDSKRPQLSDLRESGAIEQDADMVIFIHRPDYYRLFKDENGNDLRGKAVIIIAKHRNGAVGDVLLTFKGQYARFENPDEEAAAPLPGEDFNGTSTADTSLTVDSYSHNNPFDSAAPEPPLAPNGSFVPF